MPLTNTRFLRITVSTVFETGCGFPNELAAYASFRSREPSGFGIRRVRRDRRPVVGDGFSVEDDGVSAGSSVAHSISGISSVGSGLAVGSSVSAAGRSARAVRFGGRGNGRQVCARAVSAGTGSYASGIRSAAARSAASGTVDVAGIGDVHGVLGVDGGSADTAPSSPVSTSASSAGVSFARSSASGSADDVAGIEYDSLYCGLERRPAVVRPVRGAVRLYRISRAEDIALVFYGYDRSCAPSRTGDECGNVDVIRIDVDSGVDRDFDASARTASEYGGAFGKEVQLVLVRRDRQEFGRAIATSMRGVANHRSGRDGHGVD